MPQPSLFRAPVIKNRLKTTMSLNSEQHLAPGLAASLRFSRIWGSIIWSYSSSSATSTTPATTASNLTISNMLSSKYSTKTKPNPDSTTLCPWHTFLTTMIWGRITQIWGHPLQLTPTPPTQPVSGYWKDTKKSDYRVMRRRVTANITLTKCQPLEVSS